MLEFSKVTAILRGYDLESATTIAMALSKTNVKNIEITLNTENALEIIRKIRKQYDGLLNVGAGTIRSKEEAKCAIDAGAKFILTPTCVDNEVIKECKKNGVRTIIGAMTPSEILSSYKMGADIIKIFPITSCGSGYIRHIKSALGNIPIMAVGGVSYNNAKQFFCDGADYLGIGSSLFSKNYVYKKDISALVSSIEKIEQSINLGG